MILAKNNIETVIDYLAAVQSNNTAMMIDAHLDGEILDKLITTYQPDFIWRLLKTGDIGYFDSDGFFYITDLKNRFLKILGKHIRLSEIKNHLQSLGYNCYLGGQDELLMIAYHQKESPDVPKAILNNVRKEVFTRFKIPLDLIQVIPIQQIFRNSSGKINYAIFDFFFRSKIIIQVRWG